MVSRGVVEDFVEYLYKVFMDSILPKLRSIADESKRYLYFLAWLNTELEKRSFGRVIITGGFAVEMYTARVYRTMDVDIIIENGIAKGLLLNLLLSTVSGITVENAM